MKTSSEVKFSDKSSSRGSGIDKSDKNDSKRVKALQEEVQKLKQQLRQ